MISKCQLIKNKRSTLNSFTIQWVWPPHYPLIETRSCTLELQLFSEEKIFLLSGSVYSSNHTWLSSDSFRWENCSSVFTKSGSNSYFISSRIVFLALSNEPFPMDTTHELILQPFASWVRLYGTRKIEIEACWRWGYGCYDFVFHEFNRNAQNVQLQTTACYASLLAMKISKLM